MTLKGVWLGFKGAGRNAESLPLRPGEQTTGRSERWWVRLGSVGGHRRIGLEELLQSEIDWLCCLSEGGRGTEA